MLCPCQCPPATTPRRPTRCQSPTDFRIKVAETSADWELAHQLLDEEHSLGAGREAGDRLCQFILEDGQIAAVLIWCAAAWHLKGRDDAIGWDPVTRSHRLKLVIQLRRFLIPDQARHPNLASQALGLALRSLTSQWHAAHGYEPLLAESFSDPGSLVGTKDNTSERVKAYRGALHQQPPLLDKSEDSHGRLENRKYVYAPIGPVEAGLPYARSAWQSTRRRVEKKAFQEGQTEPQSHTRYFLSSLDPGDGHPH